MGTRNIGPCGGCCCCRHCQTGNYRQYRANIVSAATGLPINWADPDFCTTSCDFYDEDEIILTKTDDPYYTTLSFMEFPDCVWADDRYNPAPPGGPTIDCDSILGAGNHAFVPWVLYFSSTQGWQLFANTANSSGLAGASVLFDLTPAAPDDPVDMCGLHPDEQNETSSVTFPIGWTGVDNPCTLLATGIKVIISPVQGTWKNCGEDDPNPLMASSGVNQSQRITGKTPINVGIGPGTELMLILESLNLYPNNSCTCRYRARTMNKWGLDECKKNRETIIDWIRQESKLRGWGDKIVASLLSISTGLFLKVNWRDPIPSIVDEALHRWEIKQAIK